MTYTKDDVAALRKSLALRISSMLELLAEPEDRELVRTLDLIYGDAAVVQALINDFDKRRGHV